MLRAFCMFGLGGVFLWISPHLREEVFDAVGKAISAIDRYSPYSYIAGVILVFFTMVFSFKHGSQAR